ncbi:hypothetical protein EJ03DRAFT_124930 [Teratosphaeria nubilosa]|uniref:Uncharacterized protein n=1 Tax=Teratosphaeria nubilosa TaxID=161662 RepID=A0A6G1LM67_9PEZI|nr:hypothetical protein EJ03DRAFT_124930 [Teratosphaeria nubilosa]
MHFHLRSCLLTAALSGLLPTTDADPPCLASEVGSLVISAQPLARIRTSNEHVLAPKHLWGSHHSRPPNGNTEADCCPYRLALSLQESPGRSEPLQLAQDDKASQTRHCCGLKTTAAPTIKSTAPWSARN